MPDHAILDPQAHAALRVRTEASAELGDGVMSCVTMPDEFRQVQAEYPILFRLSADRTSFSALAMFGFETGENLFLEGALWDARNRPLAMAIQPFLIGLIEGSTQRQVHIDMASPRIGTSEGMRVFDEFGRPTPYLETITAHLRALDAGATIAGDFFAALVRHDLLEPFTLEITLADGSTNRLIGYHAIHEDRLRTLDDAAIAELHAAGHLMPIFMALASLGNIGALIARKNRRVMHG
jgi:hypothetical protein